jgi:Fe-S-cluster containining protein
MSGEQWLDRADQKLVRIIDAGFAEAKRQAGEWLACRPGCGQCCHGMIPINVLDVRRLLKGMERLRRSDPERAERVLARARQTVERSAPDFPGNAAEGVLRGSREEREGFFEAYAETPCPALDPESEACEIYEFQPVACRAAGPPISFAGNSLPHCKLCFVGAADDEVEAARVDVDPESFEMSLLLELGLEQSVIAFALAQCTGSDSE